MIERTYPVFYVDEHDYVVLIDSLFAVTISLEMSFDLGLRADGIMASSPAPGNNILVVCTANICRSPMAAALLEARSCSGSMCIDSAGVAALEGKPADPIVVELLGERGMDLSGHRAKQLDQELARGFDLILAMESRQVDWIKQAYPVLWGRTFSLGHWEGADIPDPYGKGRAELEKTKELIERSLRQWQDKGVMC